MENQIFMHGYCNCMEDTLGGYYGLTVTWRDVKLCHLLEARPVPSNEDCRVPLLEGTTACDNLRRLSRISVYP
eukprot:1395023-Amorphochlora_amoeboformis.AAC.1